VDLAIRQLTRGELREAARVLTDALVDDPGWVAVAPARQSRRWRLAFGYHRAMLRVTDRHGRPIYGAFRDERLVGVAATFAAGLYPPPAWTFAHYVPPFLRAGPGASVRGLRFSAVQERGHPQEDHVYLWFLGVDPPQQRGGVGRALLTRVFEDAEEATVPVYLDTTNPANVPYYASFGFEVIGERDLFRGARIWFLRRPEAPS
jgi:ribosomal protein S18 acetylase RimI-like enzyme